MIEGKIRADMKAAMILKDGVKVTTLRGLLAGFTNELVAKMKKPTDPVDDELALIVISRAIKQRKDSIEQFRKGGRSDLVEAEEKELKIIEAYKPATMDKENIKAVAVAKKEEMQITDKSKAGMLMGAVMKELKGRADGADVKAVVEELFG